MWVNLHICLCIKLVTRAPWKFLPPKHTFVLFTNFIPPPVFLSECAVQNGCSVNLPVTSQAHLFHWPFTIMAIARYWAQMVNNMKLWGPSRLLANHCSLWGQVNCLESDVERQKARHDERNNLLMTGSLNKDVCFYPASWGKKKCFRK